MERKKYIKNIIVDLGYTKDIPESLLEYISEELRAKELRGLEEVRIFIHSFIFETKEISYIDEFNNEFIERCESMADFKEKQGYKLFKMKYDIDTLQIIFNETKKKILDNYKEKYPEIYNDVFKNKSFENKI